MTDDTMPILTRRRIEAEFARGIYDEMKTELGEPAARRILAIQHHWTAEDALRTEVLDSTPTTFNFNVTRCRYAEMYRAMGLADLGALLSCNRDGAFCEGYDPKLTLTRTQTLMGGASHCDFRYTRAPD